ncbi:MAG: nuclear transport factor 2 family protein [Verrucomicrobiota bacterium]
MNSIPDLIRACFRAYETKDRAALEPLLAADLTFSSPVDDHIDRATYFERCWPNSEHLDSFQIEKLLVEGDQALVRYKATTRDGRSFRNVECFTVEKGKIRHIDVYFGSDTAESVNDEELRSVVEAWADAIRRKDVRGVADHFLPDSVGFYLAPPLVADSPLEQNLTDWFATFEGPIGHDLRDLTLAGSGDVAWCHALLHLTGARTSGDTTDVWYRLTLGFRKVAGFWKIAHAHESVPFHMDGSDRAAVDLKP